MASVISGKTIDAEGWLCAGLNRSADEDTRKRQDAWRCFAGIIEIKEKF